MGTGGTPLRDITATDTEAGYFAKFSGLNLDPTYGLLDIHATDARLSAEFVPTSGAGMTDAFTIDVGPPPVNQPPVARITTTINRLAVTASGSTSTDTDGTITGYAWNYGDGGTATGVTPPARTYALAGTYTVGLTVTDDDGATNAATKSVTVTDTPPVTALAADTFERSVATGWGTAPTGGAWTTSPSTSLAVSAGKGRMTHAVGSGRNAYLRAVSSCEHQPRPDPESGQGRHRQRALCGRRRQGGHGRWGVPGEDPSPQRWQGRALTDPHVVGRHRDHDQDRRGRAEPHVRRRLFHPVAYGGDRVEPHHHPGQGLGRTAAEPTDWLVSTTDPTAGLQVAGGLGISTYYSSTATNAPLVLAVDDLQAVVP